MGVYIKARVTGPTFDPEAQAFLTAAAITDPTITSAINTLVLDMKGYGIWTKMRAIYPFVGGTATTHKFNLKNPADTNAAFRLVFFGGWTHTSNGVQANGTNGYANTFFNPTTSFSVNNNVHISLYSRLNNSGIDADFGCVGTAENSLYIYQVAGIYNQQTVTSLNSPSYTTFVDTNSIGMYTSTRIGTSIKLFKNNVLRSSATNTPATRPNFTYFLANVSVNGNPDAGLYSNKQYAFGSIGDGLTDTEAADFYTAVQNFNTTLGRQV
jgi:hypothetical protein